MSYTDKEARIAQRRLRQIYNKKTRRERIKLAERFGYGGTDQSKLRVLRRITAQVVPQGRKVGLNSYFRGFADARDRPNPWKGTSPDYELDGLFHIVSSVMYVASFGNNPEEGDITSWSSFLNTKGKIGTTDDPAFSDDITQLLGNYGDRVAGKFVPVAEGGEQLPGSGRIIAIGLSDVGNREVFEYVLDWFQFTIDIPEPQGGEYGISLVPSRRGVKQGEKIPQVWAYNYQRPLPKGKRDRRIAYTNRAKRHYNVT